MYIYWLASSYQPDMISFRLKIVDTCPQWPRCSTACAVEAKTRSLPQRISAIPSVLLIYLQSFPGMRNGMRRRTLICPDPHLWKRRRKRRKTNVTRNQNLWRPKNERADRMRAQSPKFPSPRSPRKTSDVLTRADHFLIFGLDCRYIEQSCLLELPTNSCHLREPAGHLRPTWNRIAPAGLVFNSGLIHVRVWSPLQDPSTY